MHLGATVGATYHKILINTGKLKNCDLLEIANFMLEILKFMLETVKFVLETVHFDAKRGI